MKRQAAETARVAAQVEVAELEAARVAAELEAVRVAAEVAAQVEAARVAEEEEEEFVYPTLEEAYDFFEQTQDGSEGSEAGSEYEGEEIVLALQPQAADGLYVFYSRQEFVDEFVGRRGHTPTEAHFLILVALMLFVAEIHFINAAISRNKKRSFLDYWYLVQTLYNSVFYGRQVRFVCAESREAMLEYLVGLSEQFLPQFAGRIEELVGEEQTVAMEQEVREPSVETDSGAHYHMVNTFFLGLTGRKPAVFHSCTNWLLAIVAVKVNHIMYTFSFSLSDIIPTQSNQHTVDVEAITSFNNLQQGHATRLLNWVVTEYAFKTKILFVDERNIVAVTAYVNHGWRPADHPEAYEEFRPLATPRNSVNFVCYKYAGLVV